MEHIDRRFPAGGWRWPRLLLLAFVIHFTAGADQIIYNDSLQNGWADWSWTATRSFTNTGTYVHSGSDSISVTLGAWGGLSLEHTPMDSSPYTNLTFWINGGPSGGQQLRIYAELSSGLQPAINLPVLPANTWQQVNFSLAALGVANQATFTRFSIQDTSGGTSPVFYLDDLALQSGPPLPPPPPPPTTTNAAVIVRVDAQASRHPISPQIYGVAFASSNDLATLNFTMNRSGGNSETSYNWQLNAHNHDNDWYFESIDDGDATPGATADDFVANSLGGGAQPMITIPMIGWAPKLGPARGKLASYSIAKYGAQTGNDWQYMPDAGDGFASATGLAITNNDPNDANVPVDATFQRGYVQHLLGRWGASTNGGVRYYFMDNEHSIWFSTHQDVHPVGPTMQEIRDKILAYASMVKSNDPNALVLGPEEWGWSGYFYSGYDQQNSGDQDRAANGGWDYLPWLLNQLHQHDTNSGQRLLDYFTVHCYPQGGEGGNDISTNTEILRNQSTRQLWDTNYVDQSWIGQTANNILMLIPRMHAWVASYYPGTRIGITEYNWGAEPYINGATAQADLLGIFGREGLDLATRWTTPASNTPTYLAMKIYRNYDGNDSAFGDTSVAATVPNPDNLSAFAAIRTNDSALTVMVINKTLAGVTPLSLNLTNLASSGTAQAWQLTANNAITRLADIPYAGGVLSNTLPAQSITLLVLPAVANPQLRVGGNAPAGQLALWMDGQAGQQYILQASTNLRTWTPVSTNTFTTNSLSLLLNTPGAACFYRSQLVSP
jgi:hypothetical protein